MIETSLQLALDSLPFLLKGTLWTVVLSLGGMFFGLLLGFALALLRLYGYWPLQWLSRIYVSFFRGTPLLVQLFMIYYGLPQLGIQLEPLAAALIGFSLNMGAYTSEILRAAIASIDRGQWEAAASIGMGRAQTLYRAILPQAARTALPPLGSSSRLRQRSRVVLPEPLGPMMATTSPGATSRSMPLSTSWPLKAFLRLRTEIIRSPARGG